MMKSPRKIVLGAGAALVLAPLAYVAAQNPVKPPKPSPDAQSQPVQPAPAQAPANRPGENPPRQDNVQARITVNSNLVILPVTVKDKSGELVPDLKRDEFRVFEDSVEQHVDMFTAEAFPLSMVVLIDNDLKDKDAAKVQSSLMAILGGLATDDEAYICRFDQFFHPGKGFTNDQDKLSTELKRTKLDTEANVAPPSPAFDTQPSINNHSATSDAATDKGLREIKGQPTKA